MKVSDETKLLDSHGKTCLTDDPNFHNQKVVGPCSCFVVGRLCRRARDDGSIGRYGQVRRTQNRSAGYRAFARHLQQGAPPTRHTAESRLW